LFSIKKYAPLVIIYIVKVDASKKCSSMVATISALQIIRNKKPKKFLKDMFMAIAGTRFK